MEKIEIWATSNNALSAWRYCHADRAIIIPSRLTKRATDWADFLPPEIIAQFEWSELDLFCLLHELGHAHHGHKPVAGPMAQAQERQAWQYAADCLNQSAHIRLWQFAETCLGKNNF